MGQLTNYQQTKNRHTLSFADFLFFGRAKHNGANQSKRGVPFNPLTLVDLGAPTTAAGNNVAASQSVTVGTTPLAVINGSLASGGVATLDVPRNVVAAWTNTAVVTVTGTDQYGYVQTEASASGTSFTGKKAFKTITKVSFSADVTAATVGTGTVLGLPYCVEGKKDILASYVDNAADAGTTVGQDATSPATSTTGDVRGTYAPASAPDGTKKFRVYLHIYDHTTETGAYGVTPA